MSDANDLLHSAVMFLSEKMAEAGKVGMSLQSQRSYGWNGENHERATAYETVHGRLSRAIAVLVRDPEIVVDPPRVMARAVMTKRGRRR